MKTALVYERNSASSKQTTSVISSMGYLAAPVFSAEKALQAAYVIKFDLIVACSAIIPGDRRSLTGELKRSSPNSVIVLLADPELGVSCNGVCDGVSGILCWPLTAQALRSVVEFGIDGCGMQPVSVPSSEERRQVFVA